MANEDEMFIYDVCVKITRVPAVRHMFKIQYPGRLSKIECETMSRNEGSEGDQTDNYDIFSYCDPSQSFKISKRNITLFTQCEFTLWKEAIRGRIAGTGVRESLTV